MLLKNNKFLGAVISLYNYKMVLWTEVSQQIGLGHLAECLAITDSLQAQQISFHFIINPYPPAEELLFSKNISFDVIPIGQVEKVCQRIKRHSKRNCVIVNHRNVDLSSLKRLKKEQLIAVVIDQLGNKMITCNLLVNSAIVPEWLKYTFEGRKPKCCFGADFAILRDEFIKLHQREKRFSKAIKTVLVSMGGVDRSGATLRITEALQMLKEPVNKVIILGKGFAHMDQFQQKYGEINDPHFNFVQGANDLAERMQEADILISAGGNTVYEMACVGTPGLVFWEDPHENRQSQAFMEKGTVLHIGNGTTTPILEIRNSIKDLLSHTEKRVQMSQCGKKLVDGQGVNRIFKNIMELTQE